MKCLPRKPCQFVTVVTVVIIKQCFAWLSTVTTIFSIILDILGAYLFHDGLSNMNNSAGGFMFTIITAVNNLGYIGKDGGMPWHNPEDLVFFQTMTQGKACIVGRKTWEGMATIRPMGRIMHVVTRQTVKNEKYVVGVGSIFDALCWASECSFRLGQLETMIIGGGEIYEKTIEKVDRIIMTHIDDDTIGDTRFPEIDPLVFSNRPLSYGNLNITLYTRHRKL